MSVKKKDNFESDEENDIEDFPDEDINEIDEENKYANPDHLPKVNCSFSNLKSNVI